MSAKDLIYRCDALKAFDNNIVWGWGASRIAIARVPAAKRPKSEDYLSRLGKAFLARLDIPQGMSEKEAAERIIKEWAQEHPKNT